MQLDGWKNEETQAVARWVSASGCALVLSALAPRYEQDLDRSHAQALLTLEIVEALPDKMYEIAHEVALETSPTGSLGFVPPLATLGLARVDWLQIAEHWAGNLLPCWEDPSPPNN